MRKPVRTGRVRGWGAAIAATLLILVIAALAFVTPDTLWRAFEPGDPARHALQFIASDGRRLPRTFLRGRPTAWVFGFSRCGESCTTVLERVDELAAKLDDAAEPLAFIFVTIDPEHDTPAVLKRYLSGHTPRLVALIAPRATVEGMANHFRTAYAGGTSSRAFPSFADLSRIFLTDRSGRLVEAVELDESREKGLAEVHQAVAAP